VARVIKTLGPHYLLTLYKHYLRGIRPLTTNVSDVNIYLSDFKCLRDKILPWDNLPKIEHDDRFKNLSQELTNEIKLNRIKDPLDVITYLEDYKRLSLQENLQIQRLCLRLHLFNQLQTLNPKVYTWDYYLINNLRDGPEFANFLAKLRSALFIKSLSSVPLKKNQSFIEKYTGGNGTYLPVNQEKVDYDSILNERFLIDFKETANDFPWSFEKIEENEDALNQFRDASRDLFLLHKTEINPPDERDFSTWINDSITQTDIGPKINRVLLRSLSKEQIEKLMLPKMEPTPMKFKRSVVSIDPGNCRDTWQCFPDTLFVIKRVSHLLRQVLQPIPYSMMCDPHTAYRRRKILKKGGNFMMFDYKKCGLTVNRKLLIIMAEELIKIYPNVGFEEMLSYNDITVYDENVPHKPIRGVGLGNCNEGITLLQCVVGHWVKLADGSNSVFFNDDGVFQKETESFRSFQIILTIFKDLGMIINLEKTIISKSNIFCEDYVTTEGLDYSKRQLRILNYADIFFKQNISSAKSLYYALSRESIQYGVYVHILDSVIKTYGIEFHPFEAYLPHEFGGWRYIGRTTVNECIRFVFNPKEYIPQEGYGFIPYMKRWIYYLIISINAKNDFLSRKNIRFRQFVENPLKDPQLNIPQSKYAREILSILGVQNHQEKLSSLDDLYNIRGSHNSKPKLLFALSDRLLKARKALWKKFTRSRETPTFQRIGGHLKRVLEYLRGTEHIAANYLPPDFLISKVEPAPGQISPLGRVIFSKLKLLGNNTLYGENQMAESLLFKKFLKGSEIFSLRDNLAKNRPTSVISPFRMYHRKGQIYPLYLYYFVSDPRAIQAIYLDISRDKRLIPTGFDSWDFKSEEISLILDPLGHLYPNYKKEIDKTIHLAKQMNKTRLLEKFLSRRTDLDMIFPILPDIFSSLVDLTKEPKKTEGFNYNVRVDETLALEIAGEPDNIDQMLSLFDKDFEDIPGEEIYPEDVQDFDYIEDPDDSLLFGLKNEEFDPELDF
jgi:hypothetical protein